MKISQSEKNFVEAIHDGDQLRNFTSFLYLKQFKDLNVPSAGPNTSKSRKDRKKLAKIAELSKLLELIKNNSASYKSDFAYGDLYSNFLTALEDTLEVVDKAELNDFRPFVVHVYQNNNEALEVAAHAVGKATRQLPPRTNELSKKTAHVISTYLNRGKKLNKQTPQGAGSLISRLLSVISFNFKPQLATSMPSIRRYNHKDEDGPTEFRMGTQAQIHNRKARVSPTFKLWLQMQAGAIKPANTSPIKHLYINVLGLDRTGIEGNREKSMTEELHGLDKDDVAVITLPADKGEMSHELLSQTQRTITVESAKKTMLQIAMEDKNGPKIQDFKISPRLRDLIFNDSANAEREITRLIDKSFEKLGFKNATYLSPAEKQAIYFHFIKYELTNYIIQKLTPLSINFSCKDGIDRGGVASAYYNLIQSIEDDKKQPMSKNEFMMALHAAPALVKGRGMNENIDRLWNAVDAYLEGQKGKFNKIPPWLFEWRDNYAPKNSRLDFIHRLENYIDTRRSEKYSAELLNTSSRSYEAAEDSEQYNSIFGKYKADEKISVAVKLCEGLKKLGRGDSINLNDFTSDEIKLLNDGRLKDIFQDLKKYVPCSELGPKNHSNQESKEDDENEGEGEGEGEENSSSLKNS